MLMGEYIYLSINVSSNSDQWMTGLLLKTCIIRFPPLTSHIRVFFSRSWQSLRHCKTLFVFDETWRLITVFTQIHKCSAFWARWLEFTSLHQNSQRYILTFSHPCQGFTSTLLPSGFPTIIYMHISVIKYIRDSLASQGLN